MNSSLLLLIPLWRSCGAWTPPPSARTRNHNRSQSLLVCGMLQKNDRTSINEKEEEEEESFIDGYAFTTKTSKVIKFDSKAGRFFETSLNTNEVIQDESSTVKAEFLSNEMIPTEILFGTSSSYNSGASTLNNDNDGSTRNIAPEGHKSGRQQETYQDTGFTIVPSVVEKCYDAWNRRDMSAVVNCFDDDNKFEYQDSQYLGAFTNKNELKQHFEQQAKILPSDSQIILDAIAICSRTGNVGTQWHVERQSDGSTVPFSRGCSFYTTTGSDNDKNGGRCITSGFRASEMLIKPSQQGIDLVAALASRLFRNPGGKKESQPVPSSSKSHDGMGITMTSPHSSSASIIEQYFEAWNMRDMESALDCFVEDCVYQTEDPVFVSTLEGKSALRNHLFKNAAALPSSCKIILDKLAIDDSSSTTTAGHIATYWHLEVNGLSIPNLRGCSMYTTDTTTGLITSGFDVTEAPVKFPKRSTVLLSLPARFLIGRL